MPPLRSAHVRDVAERNGVTAAQALVRWSFQRGVVAIPCSTNAAHVAENAPARIAGFELGARDMGMLDAMQHMVVDRAWLNGPFTV